MCELCDGTGWKPIEADDDSCARRSQTGHRFKEGVGVAEAHADERDCGKAGCKDPGKRCEEEALLDTNLERLVSHRGEHHQSADKNGEHRRREEHAPVVVAIRCVNDRWDDHCSRQRTQQ